MCIFIAYMILMKIFMTYYNQINEAKEKRRLKKEKHKAKAAAKLAAKEAAAGGAANDTDQID